jgi:hypothetical protein
MSDENTKLCHNIMQAANVLRSHIPVLLSRYFAAIEEDDTAVPGFEHMYYEDTDTQAAALFDELLGLTERFKLLDGGGHLNSHFIEREPEEDEPEEDGRERCKCGSPLVHCFQPHGHEWIVCQSCRVKVKIGQNGGSEIWRRFDDAMFADQAAILADCRDGRLEEIDPAGRLRW